MKTNLTPCLAALALALALPPAMATEIASPVGGWNRSGLVDKSDDATVAYPNSPIDRGAQSKRSMIKGRIAAAAGKREAHQLVVNGNPLRLMTDEQGHYARPYLFGAGSNSVEVKSPQGKSLRRVQFYETSSGRPLPGLRIICAWDDTEAEIDLHIVTPDGQHAYFGHPVLSNGGGLDVDSVDGPGPEMFTMTAPLRGNYHVYINYWGKLGANGYHFDESKRQMQMITARVTLVYNENTPREKRDEFVLPMRSIGELTLVKSFTF
ncbi:DUF2135 domain-containing protein [Massilia sp. DJPM01]|uniref:YfaP family protein n=1 Tax=Massilia sp. DJPM01 TaxID=3024404 RepID=UPI00259F4647|nr:DUF2135 domain-containing protein [Massilia sp. DJPM01]MDM5177398.1 DUF2135 domain-containing protein [Massilia sp. DJPM01]